MAVQELASPGVSFGVQAMRPAGVKATPPQEQASLAEHAPRYLLQRDSWHNEGVDQDGAWSMAVYRFASEIGEDRRVEIPRGIPAGPAQIVVIPQAAEPARQERFRQMVRKMAQGPYHTRSKQDIDAELRRERESWE